MATLTKERRHVIMLEIGEVYAGLSPENLTCDGEASNAHVVATSRKLFTRLAELEKELGHKVSEGEANRYYLKTLNLK